MPFSQFFHFVSPARQNEFTFSAARFPVFLHTVKCPDLAIQAFFSFFGHFGVQIFIFLSAYGLSRSHWEDPASWGRFVWGRVRKLYPQFGLVVIPVVIVLAVQMGPVELIRTWGAELILMLAGLSTLLGFGLPPVGPWWFIPFIVQFYVIWPFLRTLTKRCGWRGLVLLTATCMMVTSVANPLLDHWSVNLLQTPFGRMPGICFGIMAARYPLRITAPVALLSMIVLLLGSRYAVLWPFTFLGVLVVVLWSYGYLRGVLRGCRWLERLGHYSLLIFLSNGIVREEFVSYAKAPVSQLIFGCVSAAVSVLIAGSIYEVLIASRPSPDQARNASQTDALISQPNQVARRTCRRAPGKCPTCKATMLTTTLESGIDRATQTP